MATYLLVFEGYEVREHFALGTYAAQHEYGHKFVAEDLSSAQAYVQKELPKADLKFEGKLYPARALSLSVRTETPVPLS